MDRVSTLFQYDRANKDHSGFGVGRLLTVIALLLGTAALPVTVHGAATESKKMPVVPKWERFERAFKSKVRYANPLQDTSLTVRFTSPLGETFQVYGFWDGGKVWRVRFSPNQPGRWTFKTSCSDESNRGLHNQSGEFLCTAPIGPTRFDQHGLVRIASDHLHFEHADGTPFFCMADTVWNGCRQSEPKGWNYYAGLRLSQGFCAAVWSVAPGQDSKGESAWTGYSDRISINPDFFKRLDTKVDTLTQAGILSVIAPLAELQSEGQEAPPLSDGQTTLFVRYVVARYGAGPVAWLWAFDGDVRTRQVAHWKHVGQSVFGTGPHAPVLLYAGDTGWLLDEFRDQSWVDAFAWKSVTDFSDDALKWTFAGPLTKEWSKEPARPSVLFLPRENGVETRSQKRFNADDIRRAAYWSLLLAPPAGLGYAAQGVVTWDLGVERQTVKITGGNFPVWQKSLFLPGAKQMSSLASFISPMQFWNLRPHPELVATQPGDTELHRYVAAGSTDKKDLSLLYVPEDRTVEVALDGLPGSPAISWFKPRTGQTNPAVAVVTSHSCQFPTPEPGDWLLVMKAGK
jgi:hypothetical protein